MTGCHLYKSCCDRLVRMEDVASYMTGDGGHSRVSMVSLGTNRKCSKALRSVSLSPSEKMQPGTVAHVCNPSTRTAAAAEVAWTTQRQQGPSC